LANKKVRFGNGGNASEAFLPTRLNPEIAYLVGSLRDGTINTYGKYEIAFVQKGKSWLVYLQRIMQKVFGNTSIARFEKFSDGKGHWRYRFVISSRPIYEFFRCAFDVIPGKKVEWSTPRIILSATPKIQKYYIRGFWDADGLSTTSLGFCQVNKQALLEIRAMLKAFGIECADTLCERNNGSNHLKLYAIYIKSKYRKDFFKKIGSCNFSKFKFSKQIV